jgi:L-glutamine:scyllo-inosose aminotransferase
MAEGTLALLGGEPVRTEPFHRWPHWDGAEERALREVLEEGSWGGFPSPNKRAAAFASAFAAHVGARYGVCCANGSVAIELAIKAARIPPGSEIIVPPYTFVATASSVVHCHSVPIFCDVSPDTYCLDPVRVRAAITERTRAIIPVHLACNMADMDAVMAIAEEHDLIVIEDCAHAHGARWRGRGAGSIGHLGTFSFQTSKLMTAGEGGVVLTSDPEMHERLQSLVNCGRKEPGYDSFEGRMLGHNYRTSEWNAAILSAQLTRLGSQTAWRAETAQLLEDKLHGVPGLSFTRRDPRNDTRANYQVIVRYDPAAYGGLHRDRVIEALHAEGIPCYGVFYDPLYEGELFPMDALTNPLTFAPWAEGWDPASFSCPVTERAAYHETIWLPHPIFLGTERDIDDVAHAFRKVLAAAAELAS